jgi:dTMP kinase
MQRGVFLVLEGADGSGKTTQFNLLSERLQAVGYEVAVFDFPRYSEPSSHFIQNYLNGGYGPASRVSPYTASLFYALDRYEAKAGIADALNAGKIVLSNRFVGSNMAHQGSKFTNLAERRGFFIWEDGLEFELLGIPRPDLNIFLRVPAEISYELVGKKDTRSYTSKKHDEHEGDINHLRHSVEAYEQLCTLFPKDFKLIECTKNKKMLSVTVINNRIWETIKPLLPNPHHEPHSSIVHLGEPGALRQAISTQKVTTSTAVKTGEQLKVSVKGISLLETRRILKHLTTDNPAYFSKQKATARSLLVPEKLTSKLEKLYIQSQHKLLSNYRKIAKQVDVKMAHAVLPLGYFVNVHANGRPSDWLKLMLDLNEHSSAEIRKLSLSLSKQLSKRWPDPFKQLVLSSATKTKVSYDVLDKAFGQTSDLKSVSLINVVPRNELDILTDVMYDSSDLSRDEIAAALDAQTYQQKSDSLLQCLTINSLERETLLDKISYDIDLVTSGVTLASLLNLNIFKNVQIQPATPRFGYDVPDEIEETGLSDIYLDCFDSSLSLYSELQAAGHEYDAQYAVLLGNKVRWHGTLSAHDFIELIGLSNVALPECTKIVKEIKDKILETHPIIGSSLMKMFALDLPPRQKNTRSPSRRRQGK